MAPPPRPARPPSKERPSRSGPARAAPPRGRKLPGKGPTPEEESLARWLERYREARDRGDLVGARRAAINAKKAAPRAPDARAALGLTAHALGDWHEAAMELGAYRRFTGDRTHDPVIAECHIERGRPDRALDLLDDLTRTSATEDVWARAQVVRAGAMDARGNPQLATSILETAARTAQGRSARITIAAALAARAR